MTVAPLTVVVAINPQASFGKRREVGPRVAERLRQAGHEVVAIAEPNVELLRRETIRAVEAGTDALVVVGGDGMVSLGTNIVAQTDIPLGIVPSGTGNDLAAGLGIRVDDAEAATDQLLEALGKPPRLIDAGLIRHGELTTWFACVVSAGFDAIVNERANQMSRPRGPSRYVFAMLRELATLKPIEYEVEVDGIISRRRALLISVANNVSLGGGMRIVPHAELDDGYLDLFVVEPMSRPAFLRVFPKVFQGTHTTLPEVSFQRARTVKLNADGVIAYADGERIGPLPIEISLVPGSLRVLS
ncbi:diacylglycerol kinase [Diaminobutyricibacter tongyongensis]|uniref:Diacylglycerol kinase n=1 Tax=Leifsonia tongyongensis TaxID=1268043 RepID=A0A6L9XZB0_9MICO|nr:diacylglycerol kinase family protein [Diaminobutyricibacter tongyongensis]NEN06730.1 diacylglycerol kinase [Diaminobutyricibacter tongyongensis]